MIAKFTNRRPSARWAPALAAALAAAGCHNLAHRIGPYQATVLATGPATAIGAAPDGSWYVAGDKVAWRILEDGATASWSLPWAGPGTAGVQQVAQIAISPAGRIALADPGASLVWAAPGGSADAGAERLTILAGTGTAFYPIGDGGLATSAQIDRPQGVAWDAKGHLFVSDTGHNRIREVGLNGRIFTLAGRGFAQPLGDGGPASEAGLSRPGALAAGKGGGVVFADNGHDRLRMVRAGRIQTLAALRVRGVAIDPEGTVFATLGHEVDAWVDGDRAVVARGLKAPAGIAADADGRLGVADGDRVVLLSPG